jgi:hypothetical protein
LASSCTFRISGPLAFGRLLDLFRGLRISRRFASAASPGVVRVLASPPASPRQQPSWRRPRPWRRRLSWPLSAAFASAAFASAVAVGGGADVAGGDLAPASALPDLAAAFSASATDPRAAETAVLPPACASASGTRGWSAATS